MWRTETARFAALRGGGVVGHWGRGKQDEENKMTVRYKLTDKNLRTHGGCQLVVGEWHETDGCGHLCGPGWLHCYDAPVLSVLFNCIHAKVSTPRLFECETGEEVNDRGIKRGVTRMRLVRELEIPCVTIDQRVRFAILCAKKVCVDPKWNSWADRWLSGADRSKKSAEAAGAASRAADAAAEAAEWAAALQLAAAERAAAEAAEWAAEWAEARAAWDAEAAKNFNLIDIAHQSMLEG
jgi:hypothetical protein